MTGDQLSLICASEPAAEKPSRTDLQRQADDLRGRAYEIHCEADECDDDDRRAELRRRAVELEMQADDILPVEYSR